VVDTRTTALSVENGLTTFGRRVAVASGALAAIVSLLVDAPVWVASARGAATVLAVLLILRMATPFLGEGETATAEESDDRP
jgi:type IV secretory pathway TrbD component